MTRNWSHCFCISLTGCWKWRRLLWAACRDLQRSHSQTQWLPREEGPRHYVLCGSILLQAEQELERGNHKVIARLIQFFSGNYLDSVQSYQKLRCFTWQESLRFWILNLGFRIQGTGFQSLSVKLGFWIPIVSGIQDSLSCIPDSKVRDSVFRNADSLTWCDTCLSRASDSGEVKGFVTCSTAQLACNCVPKANFVHSETFSLNSRIVSWHFQIFLDTSVRVLSRFLRLRDLAAGGGGGGGIRDLNLTRVAGCLK